MRTFDYKKADRKYYFLKDSPLEKLSSDELYKFLYTYYSQTIMDEDVLAKHNIDFDFNKIKRFLPAVSIDEKCPYDGTQLVMKLPSLNAVDWWVGDQVCLKCGHRNIFQNDRLCKCKGCKKRRDEFSNKLAQRYQAPNHSSMNYENLSLNIKVKLAVFVRQMKVTNIEDIKPISEITHSFEDDYTIELLDAGVIEPSIYSPLEYFDVDSLQQDQLKYDLNKVGWRLNLDTFRKSVKKFLVRIANPTNEILFNSQETNGVYRNIVENVLYKIFEDTFPFIDEHEWYQNEAKEALQDWLQEYTPREISNAFLSSIPDGNDMDKLENFETTQPIQIVSPKLSEKSTAADKNKIIKYAFGKDPLDLEVFRIFFNEMFSKPDWMNELIPKPNTELTSINSDTLDQLSSQENDNTLDIPKIEAGATKFLITDHGVIIFYGKTEKLITTQLAAYQYFSTYNDVPMDSNKWWVGLTKEFEIDEFYSLHFIFNLINDLRRSNIPDMLKDA
ncbi:hypothetical protein [Companilactobacillus ginsenosidimutans]|uniref:Uncharacterized protein n=1 Tax=Companilactobacillus ginsenosidimutans TaxID=1007676 RepID=A0A0H4QGX8_9LACO|nr:hypothetical protein [Companilactobacillus ginsenosidimutans]AKP67192.1 hypothetical protein ABM34_06350 [Companilactobacillus ginsenosidimutans]